VVSFILMVVLNERYPLKKTTIILLSLLVISPTLSAYSQAAQHDQKNSFKNRLQAKVALFQERLVPFVAKMRASPVAKKAACAAVVVGSVLFVAYAYKNNNKKKSELGMQRSPSGLSPAGSSTSSGSISVDNQPQPEQLSPVPSSPRQGQTPIAQPVVPQQSAKSPKKSEAPVAANKNNIGIIIDSLYSAYSWLQNKLPGQPAAVQPPVDEWHDPEG
jgi:hypothetical protein